MGKYAIRFSWNDGHQHGIYSWQFLREHCPCAECKAHRAMDAPVSGVANRINFECSYIAVVSQ